MAVTRDIVFTVLLFLAAFYCASCQVKKCEKIKVPLCESIGYNFTSMPNMFNHTTQEEAALEINQFWPLVVKLKCSPDLLLFLCSMYSPVCHPNVKGEVPPCRSLCKRARKGCAPLLRQYGFAWPERMRCRKFPKHGDGRLCMGRNGIASNQITTTTARPTESIVKKCEKIKIPMCKGIGYNFTSMPNMFKHDTQEEAALEVHQFWPLVQIKCSPDLLLFICSMYSPLCHPHVKDEVPPCRSLCNRARKGCAPLMRQYGFLWPERMKCENFPEHGDGRLCMGRNGIASNETTTTAATTTTARPTKSNVKKCEKIKIPMSKGIAYNFTCIPNMFNHITQGSGSRELPKSSVANNLLSGYLLNLYQLSLVFFLVANIAQELVYDCTQLIRAS
ncbi:hypothetical protein OS493_034532 [Desmophyllum pertusum]|uniref:FZ domain-containing protein n=1 Tax=Desmophyllum pertusum TaxID=174260 RepID=A0A9W9YIN8_9CNID|nr:hypothetical protein OS493_034532 [Desmophyllum pertusum]